MADQHVIILGAGASGLSLAWRLASNNVRVDVLKSSDIVGGLAGTIREDGYCLDFGPHSFFSEDDQIVAAVLDLFGNELPAQPRSVKFFFNGNYLDQLCFKPYTEQFWKVSCRDLSAHSIPSHTRMSFLKTLKVLLRRRLSKVDPSLIEREQLPTYYPESGFGEITEKVADVVLRAGGTIHLNSRASEVHDLGDDSVKVVYS